MHVAESPHFTICGSQMTLLIDLVLFSTSFKCYYFISAFFLNLFINIFFFHSFLFSGNRETTELKSLF